MGDFNINLLNIDTHLPSSEFIESFYSFGIFPLINKPTRVTDNSTTLIDNIFSNEVLNENMINGIFYTKITDHFPIFSINCNKVIEKPKLVRKARSYSKKNIELFEQKLQGNKFHDVTEILDGKNAFDTFYKRFCLLYEECFPIKQVKQGYKNKKGWLTEGLKKSIKKKNSLYIRTKRSPTSENNQLYKTYKTNLNKLLRIEERKYYADLLESNKSNLKKLWIIIKDVINKKKSSTIPKSFRIGNDIVTDRKRISEKFNKFFTNIGKDLAKKIPRVQRDPLSYLTSEYQESIFLEPVIETEVERIITTLKNASPGFDGIHSKIIKSTYKCYIKPLTHVLNLSLSQGFFPNQMKIARVVPLHKNGDHSNVSNYRPVSILPLFSKIMERLMYDRLVSFINKHNILYKFQFGFRNKHSTNMALIVLIDKIVSAIDKGEVVIGIFLDLKKAFDTVNHNILLQKLHKLGIRGVAHKWLSDYLCNRQQFVSFDGVDSKYEKIICGVPQGSILGPLLFLLYVNDMANVSDLLVPIVFADDTNIFLSGKNVNETINIFNIELCNVIEWLSANQLSLNIAKTHYMVFKSSMRKIEQNANLTINNHLLEKVTQTKFIGVTLDSSVNWTNHIQTIRNKVSRGLGIIIKAKKVFNLPTLITLYNSFIFPHLIYCIEVWGNAPDIYLTSLLNLQKKVVRIMRSAHYLSESAPIFRYLNLLPLKYIYKQRISLFMFKFIKNMLPNVMNEIFIRNSDLNRRNTRQDSKLHIPLCRTTLFQNTMRYQGAKEWNSVSDEIDYFCSEQTFKKRLKKYYFKFITNTI